MWGGQEGAALAVMERSPGVMGKGGQRGGNRGRDASYNQNSVVKVSRRGEAKDKDEQCNSFISESRRKDVWRDWKYQE